jgi:hypothetical protein
MSRAPNTAAHIVLQYGIDMLDQAYADLPAEQQAQPHIQQAMAALDELDDAIATSLARAMRRETSTPPSPLLDCSSGHLRS